jgi:hypothetical protein
LPLGNWAAILGWLLGGLIAGRSSGVLWAVGGSWPLSRPVGRGDRREYWTAALTADAHSPSGMRERNLCVVRQRSNHRRSSSNRAESSQLFLVLIGCPPQNSVLTAHDTTPLKTIHTRLPQGHSRFINGSYCDQECTTIRFTAADLRPRKAG